jgi:hypothetical protein
VPFRRAQLSVRFVINRVRSNVEQAGRRQYPGNHPGPHAWLSLISGLIDTAEVYLAQSDVEDLGQETQLARIRDAAATASEAYEYLAGLEGTDLADLPFPLVPPLQRWFDQLGLKNTAIFRARLEANYELFPQAREDFERYRDPSETLKQSIGRIEWPILRVSVPAKAFSIVPHLAIVAHEIGHALVWATNWNLRAVLPDLDAAAQKLPTRLRADASDEMGEAFNRVLTSWIQEFAADAFMLLMTGPAGYFSLADFLQFFGSGGGYSPSHPSSYQRRKVLYQRLVQEDEGASFTQAFEEHTGIKLTEDFNSPLLTEPKSPDEIFENSVLAGRSAEESAAIAELYPVMPKVADLLFTQAKDALISREPSLHYRPKQFSNDLNNHMAALLEAIPPIEDGEDLLTKKPLEINSILNIGWVVMLTKLDELRVRVSKGNEQAERLEKLNSLLLKGVELSEARRIWSEIKT